MSEDKPLGIDGKLWAEAFCELHPTVDLSDALGWFCNAIMAGFDEGVRRVLRDFKGEAKSDAD
jgi:hypothetical protein